MAINKDSAKKLYTELTTGGYNIGSEDKFMTAMGDPARRRKFYDVVTAAGANIGSFDDFESRINSSGGQPSAAISSPVAQARAVTEPNVGIKTGIGDTTPQKGQSGKGIHQPTAPENIDGIAGVIGEFLGNLRKYAEIGAEEEKKDARRVDAVKPIVTEMMPQLQEKAWEKTNQDYRSHYNPFMRPQAAAYVHQRAQAENFDPDKMVDAIYGDPRMRDVVENAIREECATAERITGTIDQETYEKVAKTASTRCWER